MIFLTSKMTKKKKIKFAIEQFFENTRYNIYVYRLIKSKEFSRFKKLLIMSLNRQINNIATVDKINEIIGLNKAVKVLTKKKYLWTINQFFIPTSKIIDKDEALSYLFYACNLGGQTGLDKLRVDAEFDLENPKLLSLMDARVAIFMDMIDETTKSWIARTVEEGVKNDLTSYDIASFLKSQAENVASIRGPNIAEYEGILAMGEAEMMVYKKYGIKTKKWTTSHDELTCVLGGTVKISTIDGPKEIRNIVIGDYVLTHKDRYKKVIKTFKRKYFGEVVRIELGVGNGKGNSVGITLTSNHPVLTERDGTQQWINAGDLVITDNIYIEGKKCKCGKIIPISHEHCHSCSASLVNKRRWTNPKAKERLVYFNRKYDKAGIMVKKQKSDRISNPEKYKNSSILQAKTLIKKWENDKVFRDKMTENNKRTAQLSTHPFKIIRNDPVRFKETLKKAHQAIGRNHNGKTYLEKKVEWFLSTNGIPYESQWFYEYNGKKAWADFYLKQCKCVIECDGEYWHSTKKAIANDKEKDISLKKQGYTVLRFTGDQIRNNFEIVASKIRELNCILSVSIKTIEKRHLKPRLKNSKEQIVYNLSVEGDNSYIANSIVVHNCEFCYSNEEAGTIDINEIFPGGVIWNPQHQSCRCFVLPIIPEGFNNSEILWTGK